jgi:hypothetical protein
VREIAAQKGLNVTLEDLAAFEVVGRRTYAGEMKARAVQHRVFVAVHRGSGGKATVRGIPSTRILVAHAQNDSLVRVFEYTRR